MSTNKTQNYNLHSWVPEDDFLRSEFNDNFTGIDAALKSLSNSLAAEATAWEAAVSAEATARQNAVSAEATARQNAVNAEINARKQAVTAEAQARAAAVATLTSAKTELVTGVYTGDNQVNHAIKLGFQPRAVLIVNDEGYMGTTNSYQYGGLCLAGHPLKNRGGSTILAEITSTGFTVHRGNGSGTELNSSNYTYYYIALK